MWLAPNLLKEWEKNPHAAVHYLKQKLNAHRAKAKALQLDHEVEDDLRGAITAVKELRILSQKVFNEIRAIFVTAHHDSKDTTPEDRLKVVHAIVEQIERVTTVITHLKRDWRHNLKWVIEEREDHKLPPRVNAEAKLEALLDRWVRFRRAILVTPQRLDLYMKILPQMNTLLLAVCAPDTTHVDTTRYDMIIREIYGLLMKDFLFFHRVSEEEIAKAFPRGYETMPGEPGDYHTRPGV